MRISFFSLKSYPLFNPALKSTFGGSEVQLYLIGKEFVSYKRDEIFFIVADYGQTNVEEIGNLKVIKSINFNTNYLFSSIKLIKVLQRINPDIIILRSFAPLSGFLSFYISRILKSKLIFMIPHDSHTDGSYKNKKGVMKYFFTNMIFKYSNLVITQNEYQKGNLEEQGIRSATIGSGYPIPEKISPKEDCILWVGRSELWKRPELFLELAELKHKKKFVMVCPPSTYNPELSKRIEKRASGINNLKFVEFVPFNEIDQYFQKAKVFVNTSTQEGFPNTFIQATKNGTPIISLDVNPDNLLGKYDCGFFCDGDLDEMDKRLDQLLNDADLYKRMSDNAYNYAKENHDIEKNAEELYRLIMDLKC